MYRFAFRVVAVAAAIAVSPAPAMATVVIANFGGTAANASSFTYVSPSLTLTVEARRFSVLPASLTSLTQLSSTDMLVSRTVPGIGVAGGASAPQIDTNQAARREGILISGSADFSLRGMRLSFIDNDDTLQVYGVDGNTLVSLGYPGVIRAGLAGPNSGLSLLAGQATGPAFAGGTNSGTQALALVNPTDRFSAFFFTTRERGDAAYLGTLGQGYRIDSLTVGVPEAATWAMLIAGFGMVGAASRRRRSCVTA